MGERAPARSAALSQKAALQMPFAATTPPVKMRLERSAELVGAKSLHLLTQTALPLKSPTGAFIAALRSANAVAPNAKFKIFFPLLMRRVQRRRPPPAAETGRSCWGSGQQDASAAQGTMRMLGAATRKKRKPFQIVLLPNPHPICKFKLHLFCVLRRFSAILRQCKKLCGFCLTGGCLRAIMNT